ncbi:MAG: LppX_LprAFG lipoprotein [Chloroflexi bacterium]|nr:LppX_LprAFG lipoprotein [Chloroflexota bacterium]MDA1002175.1 LppX_LprAFG lipoprotein [Chloroflexota bacterium]
MSRRALVATALLALTVSAAAACGGGDDGADLGAVDAPALLESAAARIETARSFRFTLEHENGATAILSGLEMRGAKGEVAGPDELSMTVDAQAGPLSVQVSIVVLPDESWVTNPLTGRWERQDIDVSAFFDPAQGVTALMRGITDAHVTTTDEIGGAQAYVVEATIDSGALALFAQGAPAGTALAATAWIGVDDPLVYRIEITGGITSAEPANLVRRLTLSDWGAAIAISPPR